MKNEKKGNPPKTAEGPATKEPEQSPSTGSTSGVVEAAMKVFGDFTYEALRHHKERATKVKEFHAATNLIWDALRALPQAPATPAAAPVEEESRWCKSCGLAREWHRPEVAMIGSDGKPCKDFVPQPKTRAPGSQGAAPGPGGVEAAKAAIKAELDAQMQHYSECAAAAAAGSRLYQDERDMTEGVIKGLEYAIKAVSAAPAPGSQGVEGHRKEAREWTLKSTYRGVVVDGGIMSLGETVLVREVRAGEDHEHKA